MLQASASVASAEAESPPKAEGPKPALDPGSFIAFPVTEIEQLTHDTKRIRLALPDSNTVRLQCHSLPVCASLASKA